MQISLKTTLLAGVLAASLAPSALARGKEAEAPAAAVELSDTAAAAFTDSSVAGLNGNKRVVIADVVVHLQTAMGFTNASNFLLGKANVTAGNADAILTLNNYSSGMLSGIGDALYKQLAADLTAAGYEVVPEAQLKASATYQDIIKSSGIGQFSRYANRMGNEILFGPSSLGLYLPYSIEVGTFQVQVNPLNGGDVKQGFGGFKGSGENAPQSIKVDNDWKLPGKEVALAKELNANVVKATYVLTFGKISGIKINSTVSTDQKMVTDSTSGAKGVLALGLLPDQTRIAFRAANGAKWQKRSMFKLEPAKDGDVVVRLANQLIVRNDVLTQGESRLVENQGKADDNQRKRASLGGGLFGGLKKAIGKGDVSTTSLMDVNVSDAQAYATAVNDIVKKANAAMLALVKQ